MSSSGDLWAPDLLRHPPVDPGQQIRELSNADSHDTVGHRRPQEAFSVEPLRKQARTLAVVPNDFDQIASKSTEDVEVTAVWLCGAPHNHSYVSGKIMWRGRRDDSQGLPCRDSSAT